MKKSILKNNKGFTLVELLAVIVIMGILMMVAIPSVSAIIFDSRVSTYVQAAQGYVKSAKNFVADGSIKVSSYDATYYIHINNLVDSEVTDSPFAPWNQAYVAVTKDLDNKYKFYWISADKVGWRIDLTEFDKLEKNNVYQGDKTVNFRQPIGGRERIIIYDENGEKYEADPFYEMTRQEAQVCFKFEDKSSSEMMIIDYIKDCGTDVVIPGKIDGKVVTSIYQYAFENKGIMSVYIPDSVTSIGSRAFYNNNLVSVYIPSSVKTIGSEAFMNNKITNLVIEEGLDTIGQRAFMTNKLKQPVIPNSVDSIGSCSFCNNDIPNASFLYVKNDDGTYDYSRVRGFIGNIDDYSSIMKFEIPATSVDENGNVIELKRIESEAFSSMGLNGFEVIIPNTVTYIGSGAFKASKIAKVTIPDSVTEIASSAFYNNKLTELIIPDSVKTIGSLAFNTNSVVDSEQAWIYKRTESGIDYSVLIGYAGGYRGKSGEDFIIPPEKNGVQLKEIAGSALRYLSAKGNLIIPESVKKVSGTAFSLNYFSSVDNGDHMPTTGIIWARDASGNIDYTTILAFANGGVNAVVPEGVKKISDSAYYYSDITGITLPEGVETIGKDAFRNCNLKGTVVIPSTVKSIGKNAFRKESVWSEYNIGLTKFVNKAVNSDGTPRSFDWQDITGGPTAANFAFGTVRNWYGDIEVVAE